MDVSMYVCTVCKICMNMCVIYSSLVISRNALKLFLL